MGQKRNRRARREKETQESRTHRGSPSIVWMYSLGKGHQGKERPLSSQKRPSSSQTEYSALKTYKDFY